MNASKRGTCSNGGRCTRGSISSLALTALCQPASVEEFVADVSKLRIQGSIPSYWYRAGPYQRIGQPFPYFAGKPLKISCGIGSWGLRGGAVSENRPYDTDNPLGLRQNHSLVAYKRRQG